ncbi:MAG TPA: VIT domain-containing protein [Planctomycetota bacterium]|jgi:tetratricopeptide (TPR) repeat protein
MKRKAVVLVACALLLSTIFVLRPKAVELSPGCPVSLTNPDGQALNLEKYDLRVAVNGPLSLVEMEMTFRNPLPKQMEGRFLYLLPAGATISRFAKEVNGKLMEGEVVERMAAQRIYTEILHTMRDPALLEMDQGNRFSARVFPIAPNGAVRLLLAYSQLLPVQNGERKLRVALAGIPKIGAFSFTPVIARENDVNITGIPEGARNALADFTPEKDLEIVIKGDSKAGVGATKAGNFQMLCYQPTLPAAFFERIQHDWSFYFDTSASNADIEARRLDAIERLFKQPGLEHGITAYAFDLDVSKKLYGPEFNSLTDNVVRQLRARHALGATNIEAVMKHIGEQARAAQKPTRFVLVSDGITTIGAREPKDILAAMGDWPAQHTLHALVIGNKQDEKMLNAIVEKGRGRVVTLPFTDKPDAEIARAVADLQKPAGASFEFYDEGAAWIYPKTFRDVQPGSELIVFSELKKDAPSKPGVVLKGGGDTQLSATPTEIPEFAPLLQREAYRAFLDHLEKTEQVTTDPARVAQLRKQRVETSVKNRVLCPLTSLLVLETEDDYRRFGVERTALADVMQIGKNGIELRKRGADEVPPALPNVATKASGDRTRAVESKAKTPALSAARPAEGLAESEKRLEADKDSKADDVAGFGGQNGQAAVDLLAIAADAPTGGAHPVAGRNATPGQAGGERQRAAASTASAAVNAPAPASPAAEPAARALQDSEAPRQAEELRRRNDATPRGERETTVRPPAKPQAPDWTKQYEAIPTEQDIGMLRAQVQAQPRDRTLRNALASMLQKAKQWDSLQGLAFEWLPFDPENPQVFEFLGNSATGLNDPELALRAFTSIAEVAPNRAALLARAGWLLMVAKKYEMSEQMFREALKNRQDDCNIYRGLAYSLWLRGKYDDAAKVFEDTLAKDFNNRYGDVKRVMSEELGYIFRAWQKSLGDNAKAKEAVDAYYQKLEKAGRKFSSVDALRVTMCWETDANDVDLHVVDPNGEECFYSHKNNASGLELYSDQTQGLGPEVIRTAKAVPGTYHIAVNYFSAGPMGVSRGVVVIMQPKDGIVEQPVIVPFCLLPGGPDLRHIGVAKF